MGRRLLGIDHAAKRQISHDSSNLFEDTPQHCILLLRGRFMWLSVATPLSMQFKIY